MITLSIFLTILIGVAVWFAYKDDFLKAFVQGFLVTLSIAVVIFAALKGWIP